MWAIIIARIAAQNNEYGRKQTAVDRLANDLDIKTASPLPRPEIARRLGEVKKQIEKMMDVYLGEDF